MNPVDEWKHLEDQKAADLALKYHTLLHCKMCKQTGEQTQKKIRHPSDSFTTRIEALSLMSHSSIS